MKNKCIFTIPLLIFYLTGCSGNTDSADEGTQMVITNIPVQQTSIPDAAPSGEDNMQPQPQVSVPEPAPVKEEPAPAKIVTPYDNASVVYGKWSMMGATVIVYQKNGRCYMVNHYGGSNYGDPELFYKTTFRGMVAFRNAEDPDDLYAIEPDGSLGGYYEGDKACSFQPTL